MTTLAIAIVAHPKRAERAAALAVELDAHVVMDDGEYGDALNHARAWEWLAEAGTEWSLAVEDDAVPVAGLRAALEAQALPAAPRGLISLYVGTDSRDDVAQRLRAAYREAERTGTAWLRLRALYWGVAVAAPTDCASGIAARLRRFPRLMSDTTVSRWARRTQTPIHATFPSMVDHDDGDSVLGHGRRGPRKAIEVGLPTGWGCDPVLD